MKVSHICTYMGGGSEPFRKSSTRSYRYFWISVPQYDGALPETLIGMIHCEGHRFYDNMGASLAAD